MDKSFRIESVGSFWEIDPVMMRYRRWPKYEGPRERPEWGDERAGPLQDAVWHEMVGDPYLIAYEQWMTFPEAWGDIAGCLRLPVEQERATAAGPGQWVQAPLREREFRRLEKMLAKESPPLL